MDPGSGILVPGFGIQDPGFWIQDPDPGSWIQVLGPWIQDPGYWILDPGSYLGMAYLVPLRHAQTKTCQNVRENNNPASELIKKTVGWGSQDPNISLNIGKNTLVPGKVRRWHGGSGWGHPLLRTHSLGGIEIHSTKYRYHWGRTIPRYWYFAE